MTWNPLDAELEDTLHNERRTRAVRSGRCWIKGCDDRRAEMIRVPSAKGRAETHGYCEHHAPDVHEHNRVLHRILQIPPR